VAGVFGRGTGKGKGLARRDLYPFAHIAVGDEIGGERRAFGPPARRARCGAKPEPAHQSSPTRLPAVVPAALTARARTGSSVPEGTLAKSSSAPETSVTARFPATPM